MLQFFFDDEFIETTSKLINMFLKYIKANFETKKSKNYQFLDFEIDQRLNDLIFIQ